MGERKLAYAEYFLAQLEGDEKPCEDCDNKGCDFKGQFDSKEAS